MADRAAGRNSLSSASWTQQRDTAAMTKVGTVKLIIVSNGEHDSSRTGGAGLPSLFKTTTLEFDTAKTQWAIGRAPRERSSLPHHQLPAGEFVSEVMSKVHAYIEMDKDQKVFVRDAGSTHGTFTSSTDAYGKNVPRAALHQGHKAQLIDGELITFGKEVSRSDGSKLQPTRVLVRIERAPASTPPAAAVSISSPERRALPTASAASYSRPAPILGLRDSELIDDLSQLTSSQHSLARGFLMHDSGSDVATGANKVALRTTVNKKTAPFVKDADEDDLLDDLDDDPLAPPRWSALDKTVKLFGLASSHPEEEEGSSNYAQDGEGDEQLLSSPEGAASASHLLDAPHSEDEDSVSGEEIAVDDGIDYQLSPALPPWRSGSHFGSSQGDRSPGVLSPPSWNVDEDVVASFDNASTWVPISPFENIIPSPGAGIPDPFDDLYDNIEQPAAEESSSSQVSDSSQVESKAPTPARGVEEEDEGEDQLEPQSEVGSNVCDDSVDAVRDDAALKAPFEDVCESSSDPLDAVDDGSKIEPKTEEEIAAPMPTAPSVEDDNVASTAVHLEASRKRKRSDDDDGAAAEVLQPAMLDEKCDIASLAPSARPIKPLSKRARFAYNLAMVTACTSVGAVLAVTGLLHLDTASF